jgi:hypothetical protein
MQALHNDDRYPSNLKVLENKGYIAKIPMDPFTQRNDSWRTIPAKPTDVVDRSRLVFMTSRAVHDVRPWTAPGIQIGERAPARLQLEYQFG